MSPGARNTLILGGIALLGYIFYQPGLPDLRTKNPKSTALMRLRVQQARRARTSYSADMIWEPLDQISPNLIHAVLISEDDMFYQHHGFDLREIWEAVKVNWQKKRFAYGGSTITQQLARTLYLSPRKNLLRKLKEAAITLRLEYYLPKKRILEIYLNVIEWGRGIYGAEAASRFYYGKPAIDLTPDEAIALASILPSPRRWSPVSGQEFMNKRRNQLLDRMRRAGYVPPESDSVPANPFDSVFPPTQPPPLDQLQGDLQHDAPSKPER
jgi:monofunctional biosynthetic peptidoglycan transglycosylase